VEVFESLGKSIVLMPSVMADLEWYVCAVYGKPKYTDVNKMRYDLFKARYQPNATNKRLGQDDGIDLSLLPPCRSSLKMHALRANYVAYTWKQAHVTHPEIPSLLGLGWTHDAEGVLAIQWSQGDIMPQGLLHVLACQSPADPEDAEEDIEEDCEIDNTFDVWFDDDDCD